MFSFKTAAHFFASLAHDMRVELDATAQFLTKHQGAIDQAGEIATTVISIADPALAPLATSIERAGEALLGEALAAVSKADAAVNSPLNITLDVAAIAELKTLFADITKAKGSAAVLPAGLA